MSAGLFQDDGNEPWRIAFSYFWACEYNCAMTVSCGSCKWSEDIPTTTTAIRALYRCPHCKRPVTIVDISAWSDWIRQRVDDLETQRQKGQIGTRKQSPKDSDAKISADGMGAELAACLILAPWRIEEWQKRASESCS